MRQENITSDWVMARFDDIYPVYRTAFARLLVTLRADFDGDLDAMLVLLTLSLGTERQNWGEALLGQAEQSSAVRVTNTLSISEATGIPRETVRRKLDAMAAKGWIVRDAKRNWAPTKQAAQDLRKSSRETIDFLRALLSAARTARPRQTGLPPRTDG